MSPLRNSDVTTSRSRNIARVGQALGIAALLGGTGLAACSDAPSAPGAASPRTPSLNTTSTTGDTTYTSFRVDPKDNRMIVIVGTHKLDIPPGAICDVATSGYGVSLWDAPCAPSPVSVTFTAKTWTDANGNPQIHFSPDVRFVPGKVVTLSMKAPKAALDLTSAIAWCPSDGSPCVNEALTDPTLVTLRDTNGFLVRRLKHFSGYNVVFGFGGDGGDGTSFGQ